MGGRREEAPEGTGSAHTRDRLQLLGGRGGAHARDRLQLRFLSALLPLTSRHGLETFTSLLCISFTLFAATGGSVFCFTMSYTAMY